MIANLKPVHFTMDTNHFLSFGVLLFILNMIANTVSSKTSMLSLVKYDSYWCHMHAHVHACDMWCNETPQYNYVINWFYTHAQWLYLYLIPGLYP